MTKDAAWLLKEKYTGQTSEAFIADCQRLQAGEPLAYVIGSIPFLNCQIYLDSKPLIPRPETEFWVEKFIQQIRQDTPAVRDQIPQILDLCAGSGCIGVAVQKALLEANVDFAEIDHSLLPTISKNLSENCTQAVTADIIQSDLFSNLTKTYDFILTNPPYIDPALDRTQTAVTSFEPHRALYGGEDGLAIIQQIISTSAGYLAVGGELWIEHEPEQAQSIQSLASKYRFSATTHPDQYDIDRYSVLVLQ